MWQNFQPKVDKIWLYLIAGLMWTGVGLMLISLAVGWLVEMHTAGSIALGLAGLLLALAAHRFPFSNIARKNILRLDGLLQQAWLFAFMPWKSYLLVAGMMAFGALLRRSLIPHGYLAVVYAAIGGALFLSSLAYYRTIFAIITNSKRF